MTPDFPYSERTFAHSVIKYNGRGFFEIHCTDEYIFDIADIKEVHAYLEECGAILNEKVLVVSYANRLTNIKLEAINYISKGPHTEFIRAEAFVINSLPQKLMGNFFMKNFRPKVPAKVFTNKEEAEKWLMGFRSSKRVKESK